MAGRINGPRTIAGRLGLVEPLTEQRAAYNELLALYAAKGKLGDGESDLVPFPSGLRSDILLTGSLVNPSSLNFSFRTDQPNTGMTTVLPTDNRLDLNDEFFVTRVKLGFGIYTTATQTASDAKVQQWPNPATAPVGFDTAAPAVNRAFNGGRMSIECNAVKFMDALPLSRFRFAGTSMSGVAVSTVATTGVLTENEQQFPDGFFSLVPSMLFGGRDKTKFEVILPEPLTFLVTSNTVLVSLQLDGIRIQNATPAS